MARDIQEFLTTQATHCKDAFELVSVPSQKDHTQHMNKIEEQKTFMGDRGFVCTDIMGQEAGISQKRNASLLIARVIGDIGREIQEAQAAAKNALLQEKSEGDASHSVIATQE